jgi:hypothetical protein
VDFILMLMEGLRDTFHLKVPPERKTASVCLKFILGEGPNECNRKILLDQPRVCLR